MLDTIVTLTSLGDGMTAGWLIAHQGGWDEILVFAAPIAIAVVVVMWADRRGRKKRAGSPPPGDG